jgi:hypothetical protein
MYKNVHQIHALLGTFFTQLKMMTFVVVLGTDVLILSWSDSVVHLSAS